MEQSTIFPLGSLVAFLRLQTQHVQSKFDISFKDGGRSLSRSLLINGSKVEADVCIVPRCSSIQCWCGVNLRMDAREKLAMIGSIIS